MKNKKGFTLVELLAVIVILALIMGIAVISIGGVLNSARQSTLKETAVSIINGVRQQVTIANELKDGDYVFTTALLEKGGTDSPLGGKYKIATTVPTCTGTNQTAIGSNICRINVNKSAACNAGTTNSFVRISSSGSVYTYSICLVTDGNNKSIIFSSDAAKNSTEANLLDSNNTSMIATPAPVSTP